MMMPRGSMTQLRNFFQNIGNTVIMLISLLEVESLEWKLTLAGFCATALKGRFYMLGEACTFI